MDQLVTFLGWCTVLNYGVLLVSTFFIVLLGDFAKNLHGKLFKLRSEQLDAIYFVFLGNYKLAIFVFNLTPYIALKILE
jgi:hypothetical protein